MKYLIDIDGVICNTPLIDGINMYILAIPIKENIEKVNRRFDEGHEIVLWTARGARTKIDWSELTKKQLEVWGVKYTTLSINEKPHFDFLIDDKAINIEHL